MTLIAKRKPWDSNPQAALRRHLFSRQAPHPAGWLPSFHRIQVPGAGIEPAASSFRARRHYQQQLPRSRRIHRRRLRRLSRSSGRRIRTSIAWFKARQPAVSRSPSHDRKCPAGVEPASPAWKAGASAARPRARHSRRKERESNPQGSSLDRFRDGCHRQLACPSVSLRAAAAGIEPASRRLTGRLPVPARAPPQSIESGRPDLNRRSPAPEAGGLSRLSYIPCIQKRPAGVEPALPPWQGSRLPLHHGHCSS